MRVLLYHPWIYLRSGVERAFTEIVARSRHEWILCTHHFEPDATYPELRDADVRVLQPEISVQRSTGPLSQAALTIATTTLPPCGAGALLVSSEGLGDLVLARNHLPAVAYCHTPLKIRHDPVTRARLAERDRRKARLASWFGPGFDVVDRRLWRRYRHVFVNSSEVRDRVARAGLRPDGPVEVLHPGVDTDRYVPGGQPRRGLLVAGRIMWQKRIELAIDAYRQIDAARVVGAPPLETLTIAGAVDIKSRPYLEELRARARGLDVQFVTDPDDRHLLALLQQTRALVFTAPNEDFGMVMLEALACGTPVLAPDRGGPQEIVTPGCGWLVADDVTTFARHMLAILADEPASTTPSAARARALEFGWDAFVDRLDEVMSAVATGT